MRRFLLILLTIPLLLPVSSDAVTRSGSTYYSSGGVTLTLTEPAGSIFRSGETVRLSYTTTEDAYVIIFDIDTDGYVHLLSPEDGTLRSKAIAGKKYVLPDYGENNLIVAGPTGMELIFALAVPNREQIDEEELGFLLQNEDLPLDRRFRIDGDPLLAANMIAGELVRGIGQLDGISLAYTYFYINDIVEYPRYLCAECHDAKSDPYDQACAEYAFTADFSNTDNLTYPLERGFEIARYEAESSVGLRAADVGEDENPETNIYVAFYPYDSYVYTPRTFYSFYAYDPWYWTPLWIDPWWGWDPFYPGYSRHSFYFAWSWNWGSWGWNWGWSHWDPYHYTSWWYPYNYHRHHWYGNDYWDYRNYTYRSYRPPRYRYKSDLQTALAHNVTRDPDLQIGAIRSKLRNGSDGSRYYKARNTRELTRSRSDAIRDRTKSRITNRDRLKDKSRGYIKRDKPRIHNDRRSKSRDARPNIHPRKPDTKRDTKAKTRTYRTRDTKKERTKKPVSTKQRNKRSYKPQRRQTSPPAKVKNSSRSRSSSPSRSSGQSIKKSSPRSSKSSKAKRSSAGSSRSSSSRSKSGGKTRR